MSDKVIGLNSDGTWTLDAELSQVGLLAEIGVEQDVSGETDSEKKKRKRKDKKTINDDTGQQAAK